MKILFPAEIQQNSMQSLWVRRYTTTRIIYLVVSLALVLVLASLPFIFVDMSAQSRGTVKAMNENNSIVSAIYAQVAATDLYENKTVRKGDTLIWLNTDELDEQIARLDERLALNTSYIRDIGNLLSRNRLSVVTPKYRTEASQHQVALKEKDIALRQAQSEYEMSKQLYGKGVVSRSEYLQAETSYRTCLSQKELTAQQQANSWQAEKASLVDSNHDLLSQKQQLQKRKQQYVMTAPMSGSIVQYNGIKPGNFIQAGQSVAQISTSDSLLIECYVSPSDIGYIRKGQAVQVQVDTYNYQQWGLLTGNVTELIPDVVEISNAPYFRVRCVTTRNFLALPNGYRGYLKKGMTLTGRFFLTRRSLAQLLFDKIDNWMNPKQNGLGN